MLLQLLQCVQTSLLVVMIQIGQVEEVTIVQDIDLRIVAAIALRLIRRRSHWYAAAAVAAGLGKELVKSHVFIELGKVVLLVPLELVDIRGLLIFRHGLIVG